MYTHSTFQHFGSHAHTHTYVDHMYTQTSPRSHVHTSKIICAYKIWITCTHTQSHVHTSELHHPQEQPVGGGGGGGAWEEKGRIYQPQTCFDFIDTQPLLHFLKLTIAIQLWGVGCGAKEEKARIYQPQTSWTSQPLPHFLQLTITLQPWGVGGAREEQGWI